jgi:hypothetical protein
VSNCPLQHEIPAWRLLAAESHTFVFRSTAYSQVSVHQGLVFVLLQGLAMAAAAGTAAWNVR